MSPVDFGDLVLSESAPRKVADATEAIAGSMVEVIEASLPGALAGERAQLRAYVGAYRDLAGRVLDAVGAARPDLLLIDEMHEAAFVVDVNASGRSQPATVAWLRASLEQEAMGAPFSEWVGALGPGRGTAVAVVAQLRVTLPGTAALVAPAADRRLPAWQMDDRAVVRFYRAVVDELSRTEMPLDQIASVLGLARVELALLFGVRRQALDQWEQRGVPSDRQQKLATVGEIADLLAAKLKRDRIPGVARRVGSAYGERSMLDAIAEGNEDIVLDELRDALNWAAAA